MILGKKTQVKEIGDQHLMATISKLQRQLLNEQELDPATVDYSEGNIMASKILKAKYSFLYSAAGQRHAKSSITNNAITQQIESPLGIFFISSLLINNFFK